MFLIFDNISGIDWYNFMAQLVGVIGVGTLLYGLSQRDDVRSIKIVTFSMIFWAINYAMLGLVSALLVTFIGFIRMYFSLKYKGNMHAFAFLLALIFLSGYFTYDGTVATMLPVIGSVLGIVGFQLYSGVTMRLILLSSSFLWLTYGILVENIPGIINEVLVIFIMISTIIRMQFGEEDKISLKQKVRILMSKRTGKMRPRVDFERFLVFRDRKRYLNDDFNHVYEGDEAQLQVISEK